MEEAATAEAATAPLTDALRTPGGAFVGSLVIPGSGQAALGLRRWVGYAALEALFLAAWIDARVDAGRLSTRYRDLAWESARGPSLLPRRDAGWNYYEAMSQYLASGDFDRDAAVAGVQPENRPGTYNGDQWALARSLFLPAGVEDPGAPEYAVALDYYRERAIGPAYLWSWEGHEDEFSRFRSLIGEADDELRTATGALGLILANHLVSAVDALVVARLRADARLHSHIEAASPLRWSVHIRIPVARSL